MVENQKLWLRENENWHTDVLVLLQPTSPLRRAQHIDAAIEVMITQNANTVVSVVEVPHRYNPYSVMELKDGSLKYFWNEALSFDRFRRQDLPPIYARNGPVVLVSKSEVLFSEQSFYGSLVFPLIMDEVDSIDIDTLFDLQLAHWLIQNRAL